MTESESWASSPGRRRNMQANRSRDTKPELAVRRLLHAEGILTGGLSMLATGVKGGKTGTEMIPVRSISSVTTKKDGFFNTLVSVITTGNTIDFRVSHKEAAELKQVLTQLILSR